MVSGIYLSDYYHSTKSIEEYIEQSDLSIVQEDSMIIVSGEKDNQVGVIFYPGGKVEYTAYIPLLAEVRGTQFYESVHLLLNHEDVRTGFWG